MYSPYNLASDLRPTPNTPNTLEPNGPSALFNKNKFAGLEQYHTPLVGSATSVSSAPYNGRINLIQPPSKDLVFQMMEKIELKNKPTDYRDALTGTWEHNALERAFFSAENIQSIQDTIKSTIYKLSNNRYVLPNQNIDNLKIIMRGMYLQHAQHMLDGIKEQVERLNKLVLDYVIPNLYNESIAYEKYLRDQSTLVMPLPLPLQHNRDYKHLEIKSPMI